MDTVFERAKDLREKVESLMLKKMEWGVLFSVNGQRSVSDIAAKVDRDEEVVKVILKKLADQDLITGDTDSLDVEEETPAPKAKKEPVKAKKAKEPKAKKEAKEPAKEPKEAAEVREVKEAAKPVVEAKVAAPSPSDEIDLMGSLTAVTPEPKPEPKPTPVAKAPVATGAGGGRNILVVDDSIVIQKMVEIALENESYQLSSAMKGEEAIKAVRETQPNMILLDIMLPDMSGLDVMKAVREMGGPFASIPIIILSGKDSHQDKDVALTSGANDFLTKPFHDEDLIAKVHEYIGK